MKGIGKAKNIELNRVGDFLMHQYWIKFEQKNDGSVFWESVIGKMALDMRVSELRMVGYSPVIDEDKTTPVDSLTGVIDCRNALVVETESDEDGAVIWVVGAIKGEFPVYEDGRPYRFGVVCFDQNNRLVLLTTGMDYENLEAEFI